MRCLAGKRILITGGTGFIGGRLIERLCEQHAEVRVLVQNLANAHLISRFAVEIVHGDITSADAVRRAIHGCDVVFHCAYANSPDPSTIRPVNIEGTRHVLEASLQERVGRVIHLSTIMVYGVVADGDLTEASPRRRSGLLYADTKLEAERLAMDYAQSHGLPVTVLQPTAVYGPNSPGFAVNIIRMLKTGRILLINGGSGLCNLVYVDDLVTAMILAAQQEQAVGEALIISGDQPITWREFYGYFERMLGVPAGLNMPADEALAFCRARQAQPGLVRQVWSLLREPLVRERLLETAEVTALRKTTRAVLPPPLRRTLKAALRGSPVTPHDAAASSAESKVHAWIPELVPYYASKSWARIDKARRILGYQPRFDVEAGMQFTEQWARWANLIAA
jgi:nucleoside-diphosphate-sugar epimerase